VARIIGAVIANDGGSVDATLYAKVAALAASCPVPPGSMG